MFKFWMPPPKPVLDPIYEASNPLVILPFWGHPIAVRLRELTAAHVYSVGDVSLIETFQDKVRAKAIARIDDINEYVERQHRLCELSLVKPTYQEILDIAGTHINKSEIDAELKAIKILFVSAPEGPEKRELQNKYNIYELQYRFILPPDFMTAVINYALKLISTDIKKVTEKTLLDAAIMAVQGHDNPADHLPGNFTDFNREDINRRAWSEYYRMKEETKNGRGRG